MKYIIITILLMSSLLNNTQATTFYISNAGNDSNNGNSELTSWKTIAKVNAQTFQPGDSILFNRGDTWREALRITNSGNALSPITYGAYGTGNKPLISGFIELTSWSGAGPIYTGTSSSLGATLRMLVIGNIQMPIGRWPDTGWRTLESTSGPTSITDNELTNTPNWTGADVVIRVANWVIDCDLITNHTGNTIQHTNTSTYAPDPAYCNGYFIQNDLKTLTAQGEWYYNPNTKTVHLYSTAAPSNVKVTALDTLVFLENAAYITLDNLAFEGSNESTIYLRNSGYATIQNCNINFSGKDAIKNLPWDGTDYFILNNCTIDNTNNNAVVAMPNDGNRVTVTNNTIKNTALIAGMGASGDEQYNAMKVMCDNSLIEGNTIENTGYIGINFNGNNTIVRKNFINNYNLVKDDGAGIYTYRNGGSVTTGRKVENNIVLNGPGAPGGTTGSSGFAFGIYMDGYTTGVEIAGNTVAFAAASGLFINSNEGGLIHDNLFYNNRISQIRIDNHDPVIIHNFTFNNNIIVSTASQFALSYRDGSTNLIDPAFKPSKNTFANLFLDKDGGDSKIFNVILSNSSAPSTLSEWQTKYQLDLDSKLILTSPTYSINSTGTNKITNSTFDSDINGWTAFSLDAPRTNAIWKNSSILDGGALKIATTSDVMTYDNIYTNVGAIDSTKKYIFKCSGVSELNDLVNINVAVQSDGWDDVTDASLILLTGKQIRNEKQILITPIKWDNNAYLKLFFTSGHNFNHELSIDNAEFFEADVTFKNIVDFVRFEYNASNVDKTFTLDSIWVNANGTAYAAGSTITLKPYTSIVLAKDYDIKTEGPVQNIEHIKDTTYHNGDTTCVGAYEIILVGWAGDTVDFNPGSSTNLIAGLSITFLPGVNIYEGAYLSASITTDSTFCDLVEALESPVAKIPIVEKNQELPPPALGQSIEKNGIRVFPNPNSGLFTLELTNIEKGALVCIYNMLGARVYQSTATNDASHKINLSGIRKGIYFVKVIDVKEQMTRKMVVN